MMHPVAKIAAMINDPDFKMYSSMKLTPKKRRVLELRVEGLTYQEIKDEINMSIHEIGKVCNRTPNFFAFFQETSTCKAINLLKEVQKNQGYFNIGVSVRDKVDDFLRGEQ